MKDRGPGPELSEIVRLWALFRHQKLRQDQPHKFWPQASAVQQFHLYTKVLACLDPTFN